MSDTDSVPSVYTTTESPLDLTMRRSEIDPNDYNNYYSRYHGNMSGGYTHSQDQDYYQQSQYYSYLQGNMYNSNDDVDNPVMMSPVKSPMMAPSSYSITTSCHQTTMSHYSTSPQASYESEGNGQGPTCSPTEAGYKYDSPPPSDSSILPKKRKNLWRPYDSKVAAQLGLGPEIERDAESSSDSNSGSFSDQEFKTPAPPSDPVKKRKINMLQYSETVDTTSNSSDNSVTVSAPSQTNIREENTASQTCKLEGQKPSFCSDLGEKMSSEAKPTVSVASDVVSKSQVQSDKEKLISGMKKRDIFGWSLKLMKNADEPSDLASEDDKDTGHVCQDGEKTYIELQTVKKNSVPAQSSSDVIVSKAESSRPRNNNTQNKSPTKRTSPNKNSSDSKQKEDSSEKENKNIVGKKVFIQHRDNVIECCDETQNMPKKPDVKKGISLIDLVEEIEASALRQKSEDAVSSNNKSKRVAALLDQCNHVKLQALDFLMSTVLIQEKEPQYKCRNATVQKMLNGDKIGSVSMLDVVELQVEIGLS